MAPPAKRMKFDTEVSEERENTSPSVTNTSELDETFSENQTSNLPEAEVPEDLPDYESDEEFGDDESTLSADSEETLTADEVSEEELGSDEEEFSNLEVRQRMWTDDFWTRWEREAEQIELRHKAAEKFRLSFLVCSRSD